MKIKLLLLVLLIYKAAFPQEENPEILYNVCRVIKYFKLNNLDSISGIISYPLEREYPITAINNSSELKERFSQVFDRNLIKKIADSKPEEWSEVGWRGITFENGSIWLNSSDGKIIAVNYQSDLEKKLRKDLIDKDKKNLYPSLRDFKKPIYKIQTKNYMIRIDELAGDDYRYVCWKAGSNQSSKPDLIITNGRIDYEGNGGNHEITFSNNNYTYRVFRNIVGSEDDPDITLIVEKDGKSILREGGVLIGIPPEKY